MDYKGDYMSILKYVSLFLMKISTKIHKDTFIAFEEYINQELQNILDIPMFINDSNSYDVMEGYKDTEEIEGERINIHGKELILPPNFYNNLLSNLGFLVNNNTQILIERFSSFLKEEITKGNSFEDKDINITDFKKYLITLAAKEKGFTVLTGEYYDKKENRETNSK